MNQLEIKNKKKNFIWNAIGLTLNSFNSLFFLMIVKLVNGVDTAGIFTYAFSLGCFFFVLAIYYTRTFQVSDAKNKISFNEYLTCRLVLSILSLILITLFSIISQFDFYKTLVIVLIMGFRVVEAISDCFYGAIQKQGELYKTGISLSAKAIIGILGFLCLDLLTNNLLLSIILLIVINLLIFIFYDFRNYKQKATTRIRINFHQIKTILKLGFPVFVFTALSVYMYNCQKYILTYFSPNDVQTVFGILIMPATMLSLIGTYLINPSVNSLTEYHHKKQYQNYIRLTLKLVATICLCGLAAVAICFLVGIPILNFLYHMDLDSYRIDLVLIIAASAFCAITAIFSNILTVLEKNTCQIFIYLGVAIITTLFSIPLISNYGVWGATISFLISSILLLFVFALFVTTTLHRLKKEAKT